MTRFRDGELDVLVGTTVVEVGVDVPAATMMVIEGADRFGLAQLHQLRGRVGRGSVESFCVLVTDSTDEVAMARLRAVVESNDGFALAEKDFELRKEGDVLGLAQSGFPRLRSRVAPGRRASRPRGPGACARRGAPRCRGRHGAGPACPGGRARGGLATARRCGRAGERGVTAGDAGRVIAGTARGIRLEAPGPGTRPLSDRVKETLFAILEPDLRGAVVARPVRGLGRGRHRGAVARRGAGHLRRARPGRGCGDRRQPRPDPPRRRAGEDRPRRRDRVAAPDPRQPRPRRSTSSSPIRRTPRPRCSRTRSRRCERLAFRLRRGRRQALLARRPAGRIGLLASERERRFGETMLTFYRRAEDR